MSHEDPQGGIDYPRTHAELLSWFPDDPACLDYLALRHVMRPAA